VTTPANPPGDRRPLLDRPPGERYAARGADPQGASPTTGSTRSASPADDVAVPLGIVVGTGIAFVALGGILGVTAGLVIVAAFLGWLTGRLVSPPLRAAVVAIVAVALGLLGIWLFGRIEGGVLDPVAYLLEVEGPIVVVLAIVAAGGLAAAASR
jgi:hypothetical protein